MFELCFKNYQQSDVSLKSQISESKNNIKLI